ncbi:MAG TPA: hypothetical protein VGC42_07735, partial [Kofleriaceae bacterium]
MRNIVLGACLVAACGGPAVSPHAPAEAAHPRSHPGGGLGPGLGDDAGPVDPIAALTPPSAPGASSWVLAGPVQLELGKPIASPTAGPPIEVAVFDRAAGLVR